MLVVGGNVGVDIPTLNQHWTDKKCQLFLSQDLLNNNEILQTSSVSIYSNQNLVIPELPAELQKSS